MKQVHQTVNRLMETCNLGDDVVCVFPQCACPTTTKLRNAGDLVVLCDECGGAKKAAG